MLAAEVARCFPEVVIEVGEARALAVYSSMSGILAKVPPWENFGDATAIKIYVAALFYIGWELAGSVDILGGPSIIFAVQRAHLMSAVYRFLRYMSINLIIFRNSESSYATDQTKPGNLACVVDAG